MKHQLTFPLHFGSPSIYFVMHGMDIKENVEMIAN